MRAILSPSVRNTRTARVFQTSRTPPVSGRSIHERFLHLHTSTASSCCWLPLQNWPITKDPTSTSTFRARTLNSTKLNRLVQARRRRSEGQRRARASACSGGGGLCGSHHPPCGVRAGVHGAGGVCGFVGGRFTRFIANLFILWGCEGEFVCLQQQFPWNDFFTGWT